ncbi:hypothetical protein CMUST_01260 [Corynebacterium mustelae]|uniref:Gp28/Gp37-like domain-containing protein n=1 Tax=Corynebacterium mustelae TaxID=571915 RepID=A0A0G3GTV1_9CORY|nr:hypothetical protein [Corynebacterium mustelae]AKK04601.1 hypothetical protein CMUST_01260 [Corynebacterium mustelae]
MTTRTQEIWEQGQRQRDERKRQRLTPGLIRIWDGDWNYRATITDAIESSFQWKLNDTGHGIVTLPIDNPTGKWIMDYRNRQKKNIHITMDKDGARWSGRLKTAKITKTPAGQRYYELEVLHDYEELKHVYIWPNPFLPDVLQFPRAYVLMGPTIWVLKTALMMNLWRLTGTAWKFPDDPMEARQWIKAFQPQQWSMLVKPDKVFGDDTSPWTVISARMKTFHELAAPKLADAHLMVTCTRYLEGDPDPWEGHKCRHGALIFDIVDKSGWWTPTGTATSGNIFHGLVRTIQEVVGKVDTTHAITAAPGEVAEYTKPNFLSTVVGAPYVVYREGKITGIESSSFSWAPATTVQAICGGHSAYGVNEAISAAVQFAGNALGTMVLLPTAGTIADTLLQPIYADTIAAWNTWKSQQRARELGWSHYYETFSEGADKAYTFSSITALRKAFWDTREKVSHRLVIADGAPWFVGENGKGHFFLGDRIGATIVGLPEDQIVVEQVSELKYVTSRDSRGWEIICGDKESQESPLENTIRRVRNAMGAIHDLGVV